MAKNTSKPKPAHLDAAGSRRTTTTTSFSSSSSRPPAAADDGNDITSQRPLLSADPDDDDDGDDDHDDYASLDDLSDGKKFPPGDLIIHPGRASEGDTLPGLDPMTPRTPSRVRFNLQPDIAPSPQKGSETPGSDGNGLRVPSSPAGTRDSHDTRESLDFEAHDPLWSPSVGDDGDEGGHRRPLLTSMEAPAVTMANSLNLGDMTDEEVAERLDREHRRPRSGMRAAFMNMANSIIGAGIIGQPYAFRQAGLLAGVLLLVGLTVVVDWTICLIVVNSKLSGRDSFQGTVEACFGWWGLVSISLAQWLFAFGGMVAFGVIIGDSIPHVLAALFPGLEGTPGLGWLVDRRAVIVVFVLGISLPLTLYRDISKLAKASTMALISMLVIIVTVVVQGAMAPAESRGSFDTQLLTINTGFFQAIGVISFAFVCHHNSLLIYGSLKTPTIDRFSKVTHYSAGVSMAACLLMALAGFLTFGDKTKGNVLNNLPTDNIMVNIARLCFGLNMLTTLPLEAFVCREVMLEFWFRDKPFNLKLHVLFSVLLVVSAMGISLTTCDLGVVFELVGATSACALAYILPPLCYIKLARRSWRTGVAGAIAVFGTFVMVISLVQAVVKMVKGGGEAAQCV